MMKSSTSALTQERLLKADYEEFSPRNPETKKKAAVSEDTTADKQI